MKQLQEGQGRGFIFTLLFGNENPDSSKRIRLFLEIIHRAPTIEILMALKRTQNILNQSIQPSFVVPGKEVFLQAWSLLAFSFIFAILFNAFYSDGIELKYEPPKSTNLSTMIKNTSTQTPIGWKKKPHQTTRIKPTPTPPPTGSFTRLSVMGVKDRFDKKTCVFLDARKPEEYQEGHIPGALNFYGNELETFIPLVIPKLTDKNQEIITYCHGGDCDLSLQVAKTLMEAGYTHVEIFTGGWPDWKKLSYPVSVGEKP